MGFFSKNEAKEYKQLDAFCTFLDSLILSDEYISRKSYLNSYNELLGIYKDLSLLEERNVLQAWCKSNKVDYKRLLRLLNKYKNIEQIVEKHNDEFEYKVFWGCDLQTEHERYLTEKEFKRPVFVTDYPKEIKAFYMKLNEDGKTVAAMDCLVPGIGEIIGGSQREDDYDKLLGRMEELGLKKEDYDFYLDLRKYGSARHAGFGLGFERCVMYLTGMGNIRDVIPFPRTVNNCDL